MTEAESQQPSLVKFVGVSILTSVVVVVFARLAYGLVLPSMQASLGLSFTQAALLGTITALGYLSLVLPAGLFAARFGRAARYCSAPALPLSGSVAWRSPLHTLP